jgi:hypothetical protein
VQHITDYLHNELYQTAIQPALSPVLGQSLWPLRMARNSRGSGFTTWQTRQIHSPKLLAGCGVTSNLHAIWVFLFLNLSQDLKLILLRYFGTLGDGYPLKGSNKKPSRHTLDRQWFEFKVYLILSNTQFT